MFKNMSREEHFSRGEGPAPPVPGLGAVSLRHDAQESPWISMLSAVSRPALSLLQMVLPGRARAPALSDGVPGWVGGEGAFMGQIHDLVPAAQHPSHHLAYLHCQHSDSWLTAESLAELGIQNADELHVKQRATVGYFASARSFLSQVVLNSPLAQEMRHDDAGHVLGGRVWSAATVCSPAKSGGGSNWWGGFLGAEDNSQSWLSNLSRGKEAMGPPPPRRAQQHSNGYCVAPERGTKAAVAKPTAVFARCLDVESKRGESAGPSCPHNARPTDNDGVQTALPESLSSSQRGLPLEHLSVAESGLVVSDVTAASCGEVAVLTPDQDNGYSSLEEEHSTCRTTVVKEPPSEDQRVLTEMRGEGANATVCGDGGATEEETGKERGDEEESGASVEADREEEEAQDSDVSDSEEDTAAEEEGPSATTPVCQNKAIAYIMGSPCSDDDSQSDDSLSDEDDDGFDSEGSSDFSDSEDLDEDSDDSDRADDEAEHLWNSLCRSTDPYNPRNFTAPIYSAAAASPKAIPPLPTNNNNTPSPHSSPLNQPPSPLLSSPSNSPPAPSPLPDSWDESSASEVDEAESLRLWNSFSASADPYSPLNFQGALRTRTPPCPAVAGRVRGRKGWTAHPSPPRSPRHGPATPPKTPTAVFTSSSLSLSVEAEDRLDSGFSEGLTIAVASAMTITTTTTVATVATGYGSHGFTVKKVSFCEQVEEFYTSGEEEEDRRGPWEELARDRFRFRRRVQEAEETIGYVLAPAFRALAYQRLLQPPRPPHRHHHHS